MITIFISKALLCIVGVGCYPVLVGNHTPIGTFNTHHVILENGNKSEDVLLFAQDGPNSIFSIHRPPNKNRLRLLKAESTVKVTNGCVNVTEEVFDYLVDCCSDTTVEIVN